MHGSWWNKQVNNGFPNIERWCVNFTFAGLSQLWTTGLAKEQKKAIPNECFLFFSIKTFRFCNCSDYSPCAKKRHCLIYSQSPSIFLHNKRCANSDGINKNRFYAATMRPKTTFLTQWPSNSIVALFVYAGQIKTEIKRTRQLPSLLVESASVLDGRRVSTVNFKNPPLCSTDKVNLECCG